MAPDVRLTIVDWEHCCESIRGDPEPFIAAFEERKLPSVENYQGSFSQYWLTVKDGEVVAIDEQYLP